MIYRHMLDVFRVDIHIQSFNYGGKEQQSHVDHTLLANKLLYGEPKDGNHHKAPVLDHSKMHSLLLTCFVRRVIQLMIMIG